MYQLNIDHVQILYRCEECNTEVTAQLTDYACSGTPICLECGDDMVQEDCFYTKNIETIYDKIERQVTELMLLDGTKEKELLETISEDPYDDESALQLDKIDGRIKAYCNVLEIIEDLKKDKQCEVLNTQT